MSPTNPHSLPSTPEEDRDCLAVSPTRPGERSEFAVHKHRKTASTGGGRAWTEEEEAYLLRTRQHKMPYKHIASHLHKTELACRLHYHQMSYGNNRRKRTESLSSVSSAISLNPLSAVYDSSPEQALPTGLSSATSPPSSPESTFNKLLPPGLSSPAPQDRSHAPIYPNARRGEPNKQLQASADLTQRLRLDTSITTTPERRVYHPEQIDASRLRSLYAAYRQSFWALIANQYSPEAQFSPSQLEDAFFASHVTNPIVRGSTPPTPGPSPRILSDLCFSAPVLTGLESSGFNAINGTPVVKTAVSAPSPGGRCAVSALLNGPRDCSN